MSTLALTGWPTETHGTRGTARTVRSICKGIGPGGPSSVGEATVDEAVQQEAMDEVEPEELAASMADGRLRHGKQELVSTSQASRRSAAAHMATAAEEGGAKKQLEGFGRAERPPPERQQVQIILRNSASVLTPPLTTHGLLLT